MLNKHWPHETFIRDLKQFLVPCYRQYHENMLNGGSNFFMGSSLESEAVRDGKLPPSATLCRQTTFLTRMLLNKAFGEKWNVGGGHCLSKNLSPEQTLSDEVWADIKASGEDARILNGDWLVRPDGRMYGVHYWLEKDGVILDLTADQFGHEDIVVTTMDDDRYIRDPEYSKAGSVASARNTAMKWLHNDFGFHARANRFYEDINAAHALFLKQYPAVRRLVEPEPELGR